MPAWLQRDWCSSFVLALGHFLWQGALIAIALAIALRATKTVSVRYWLSLTALLVMAVSPVMTLGWLLRPLSHVVTLDPQPIVREEPAPSQPIIPAAPFEWNRCRTRSLALGAGLPTPSLTRPNVSRTQTTSRRSPARQNENCGPTQRRDQETRAERRQSSAAARYGVLVVAMAVMVVVPLATWLVFSKDARNELASRVALAGIIHESMPARRASEWFRPTTTRLRVVLTGSTLRGILPGS